MRDAFDGDVVGLGSTRGEDDLFRVGPDQVRDRLHKQRHSEVAADRHGDE